MPEEKNKRPAGEDVQSGQSQINTDNDRALPVVLIAHRGASLDAPENTLAAVRLGFEQNADIVEVDIRLTADGRIIALHDGNTARTTGVAREASKTCFEELRHLDAGKGEKIPALEELLVLIPADKRMFLEIKCGPEILPILDEVIDRSGIWREQIALISFDKAVLRAARALLPHHQALWVVGHHHRGGFDQLVNECLEAEFDGLDIESRWVIDRSLVEKAKNAGLGALYMWTIDDPIRAIDLINFGVDGITTNRPGWLRGQMEQIASIG